MKEVKIKSTCHYSEDMVNIKDFHSNLLNIEKKSHKDTDIYYIGYIIIKKFSDYENIHSVNPLCLITHSATGYFKEKMVKNTRFLIQWKGMKKFFLELYQKLKHLMEEKNYFMKKIIQESESIQTMIYH